MIAWLHYFEPQAVLFDLGLFKIYWYGLFMAAAMLLCFLTLQRLSRAEAARRAHWWNLSVYLIIFGLLGARLYHILFYNASYFISQPWEMLRLWHGGLAIYGAIFGGLITVYFYTHKHRLSFWSYADMLAIVLPLGQALGRWGNYFNQELYGRACYFDWCIPISGRAGFFHPVFLYESLLNLLLFGILYGCYRAKKFAAGVITFCYLIGYAVIRFFLEFLRLDVSQTSGGLKWVQWLCLTIILFSALAIFKILPKRNQ